MRPLQVGLLGGSFNPPHAGHLHISVWARRRLGLQEVWWILARQNPLKPPEALAPFSQRLRHARRLLRPHHPHLKVTDLEERLNLTYTWHTITTLQRAHPQVKFVWLMGADAFLDFTRWFKWQALAARMPLAILPRTPWRGPCSLAARALSARLYKSPPRFMKASPPALIFLDTPRHTASAQSLRSPPKDNPPPLIS